jgi:hypothetical protein
MATDESRVARPHRQHAAAPHVPPRGALGRSVLIFTCPPQPTSPHWHLAGRSQRNKLAPPVQTSPHGSTLQLPPNHLPFPAPHRPRFPHASPHSRPRPSTAMASRLAVAVAAPASPSPSPAATVAPPRLALRRGVPAPTWSALRTAVPRSLGAAVVCLAQGGQDTAIQGISMPPPRLLSCCYSSIRASI